VIIGGMGSLGGAAIGALLLGLTTNFSGAYLPSNYTYYSIIFTFVLVAVVLAVRPLGLFGRPALRITADRVVAALALLLAVLAPFYLSTYWVGQLLTQMRFLGIAAASLIFLSAYGGMVSLAQVSIYGIAGFVLGNATTNGNTKGLNLGWSPWWGIVVGIAFAVGMALLFGALANRSVGIYFLMITLTYSVIANLFFRTGDGRFGLRRHQRHSDDRTDRQRRRASVPAVLRRAGRSAARVRATSATLVRTPFGLTLQGVRDDPVRMASLGYNVPLHRTIAFAFAGFIAAIGGVLFVWWNGHIDPASIDLGATIDLLVIAVVGGLYRLEGAWVGALFFVVINNYSQRISFIGPRFHTLIGAIFLVIVLVSPGGLVGLWERVVNLFSGRRRGPLDRNAGRVGAGRAQRLKGGSPERRHGFVRRRFARFQERPRFEDEPPWLKGGPRNG